MKTTLKVLLIGALVCFNFGRTVEPIDAPRTIAAPRTVAAPRT
ncbi:hypothetical protein [Bacteroides sp. 519]|nr:hypothetical protein [Bacteroides sp. 519]